VSFIVTTAAGFSRNFLNDRGRWGACIKCRILIADVPLPSELGEQLHAAEIILELSQLKVERSGVE
jgi:hypothetical protein